MGRAQEISGKRERPVSCGNAPSRFPLLQLARFNKRIALVGRGSLYLPSIFHCFDGTATSAPKARIAFVKTTLVEGKFWLFGF